MKDKLKKFFGKKENVILVSVIAIITVIVILVAVFNKKEWDRKFALNKIYDVYPEDVRKLYSNMVEVSCSGDLYLNISLDGDKVSVGALDKEVLMNYMFSYLDKNGKLNEITMNMIRSTTKYLYDSEMDLTNSVNNYKFIDRVAATVACKLSIKANDRITMTDMEDLLDRLRNTKNPFTCPHGRPTIITYSNYELERLFKRVMN